MCNSCKERTPSTSRIDARTCATEIVEGTPWRRMKEALRTAACIGELKPSDQERRLTEW